MNNKIFKYLLISLIIIIVDQIVKVVVHYNMDMGSRGQILIFGDWFKLHYLTNPGMAFGMKLDFQFGKLLLTTFRIGAMIGIAYYIISLIKKEANSGLIICIALILGGAIGNLIDSVFYGIIFDNAPVDAPSPWFHGQVIDMFYIDIWEGFLPEWIPLIGGDYMALWPVFNIADAAIFVAICFIIVYQKRYFKKEEEPDKIESPQLESQES